MVAKLVGLSGAQGAGKSTLLTELSMRGWHVDGFKVSRAVQSKLGLSTLDGVLEAPSTMVEFQETVYDEKLTHDSSLRQGGSGVILTERTFADILAYATFWTWELVDSGKWSFYPAAGFLSKYTHRCLSAQRDCYDAVLMLPYMSHVVWQQDANRASRASVNTIWESIEDITSSRRHADIPVYRISQATTEDRAAEVETFLRKL